VLHIFIVCLVFHKHTFIDNFFSNNTCFQNSCIILCGTQSQAFKILIEPPSKFCGAVYISSMPKNFVKLYFLLEVCFR